MVAKNGRYATVAAISCVTKQADCRNASVPKLLKKCGDKVPVTLTKGIDKVPVTLTR